MTVKQADPTPEQLEALSQALDQGQAATVKSEALSQMGRLAALALGTGAAARGGLGLYHMLKPERDRRLRNSPAIATLPYPVVQERPKVADDSWLSQFLSGGKATTTTGIPWYGPGMTAAALGGLYGGWKGVDSLMTSQRKPAREAELEAAREAFRAALLEQYDRPKVVRMGQMPPGGRIGRSDAQPAPPPMAKAAATIDQVFSAIADIEDGRTEKSADWKNIAGAAAGGYGTYAGLAALMSGLLVYNKMKKRSQGAIIDKALDRSERQRFQQSPPEIYALPEPVSLAPSRPNPREELRLLSEPPE